MGGRGGAVGGGVRGRAVEGGRGRGREVERLVVLLLGRRDGTRGRLEVVFGGLSSARKE